MHVSLEYPASGKRQNWSESVLVHSSDHVEGVSNDMDGRTSRYIKEVLGLYREEDDGDLRSNELNELAENMTALNVLEGKTWQSEESWKVETKWKSEKRSQKSVMDEQIVKDNVMDGKKRDAQRDECRN